MKCLFIYNPVSGKSKRIVKNLEYIKQRLSEKYKQVDIVKTEYARHAVKLASDACGVYDVIVFSGGDGTFNEVIQGVAQKTVRPILSYIPSGTACDMANNLKIPLNVKKALEISLNGELQKSDICKINDEYFVYVAAIGAYTDIPYLCNIESKKKIGKLAYFIDGFKQSFNMPKIHVKIKSNGNEYKEDVFLLLAANSKSVASMVINKNGNLTDGKIDVVLVKKNRGRIPFNVFKIFVFGVEVMKKSKSIIYFSTNKLEVEVDENVIWNVDGEKGVNGKVNIEVLKEHISFIVNNK